MQIQLKTHTLDDGSKVSDVWLIDGDNLIVLHAATEDDGVVLYGGLRGLIIQHTVDQLDR